MKSPIGARFSSTGECGKVYPTEEECAVCIPDHATAALISDGQPVYVRSGEKFIVEAVGPPEDPSTFVSLKIKQKGKRGAGPGWGKS